MNLASSGRRNPNKGSLRMLVGKQLIGPEIEE